MSIEFNREITSTEILYNGILVGWLSLVPGDGYVLVHHETGLDNIKVCSPSLLRAIADEWEKLNVESST